MAGRGLKVFYFSIWLLQLQWANVTFMTFADWLKKQPRGTTTRLERDLGISRVTLWRAKKGMAVRYGVATKISTATGGVVPVSSLCEPQAA